MILRNASDVMNVGDHMFSCTRSHTRSNAGDNEDMEVKIGSLVGAPKYKIVGKLVGDVVTNLCMV
jgi:hypothetical protein